MRRVVNELRQRGGADANGCRPGSSAFVSGAGARNTNELFSRASLDAEAADAAAPDGAAARIEPIF